MKFETIARIAYEADRIYCLALDNESRPLWPELDYTIKQKLADRVRFIFNNPDTTPRKIHDLWCSDKMSIGWVFAHVKNAAKKEHPYLLPYDVLPEGRHQRDKLFITIVKPLLSL